MGFFLTCLYLWGASCYYSLNYKHEFCYDYQLNAKPKAAKEILESILIAMLVWYIIPLQKCAGNMFHPSCNMLESTSILATRHPVIVTGIRKLRQADESLFTCLTRQYVCYPSWRCTVNGTLWDACSTSKMTIKLRFGRKHDGILSALRYADN